MLWRVHTQSSYVWQLSKHTWTVTQHCKQLHSIEWCLDTIVWTSWADSSWQVQKGDPITHHNGTHFQEQKHAVVCKCSGEKKSYSALLSSRMIVPSITRSAWLPETVRWCQIESCCRSHSSIRRALRWACVPVAPDCSNFRNACGRRREGWRCSGWEMAQEPYVLLATWVITIPINRLCVHIKLKTLTQQTQSLQLSPKHQMNLNACQFQTPIPGWLKFFRQLKTKCARQYESVGSWFRVHSKFSTVILWKKGQSTCEQVMIKYSFSQNAISDSAPIWP